MIFMKLSQFQFLLPKERVAQEPTRWRDECKLMVVHKDTGEIEHRIFKDIIDYFGKGDTFVLNDTKVFPARLYGKKEKTGADIMVFLLRELNREQHLWDVIVDPARKIRIGNKLYFGDDQSLVAEVIDNTTSRGRTLRFLYDGPHDQFKADLYALGLSGREGSAEKRKKLLRQLGLPERMSADAMLDVLNALMDREGFIAYLSEHPL